MEVKAVSNSQPSFKGYLGKNVQTYVHHIVEKEVNTVVNEASMFAKKVDVNEIKEIKFLGFGVLDKLSKYVGSMDKKTSLDLNDVGSSYIRFMFRNPIAPDDEIKIYGSTIYKNPTLKYYLGYSGIGIPFEKNLPEIYKASKSDLHTLNIIADHLLKLDSKEVDNVFYKSAASELKKSGEAATGFWSRFKVRKLAKALDEFAKGLGIDSSAQVRAEEYLRTAKERKISNKNFLKEVKEYSKMNKQIADDILKG